MLIQLSWDDILDYQINILPQCCCSCRCCCCCCCCYCCWLFTLGIAEPSFLIITKVTSLSQESHRSLWIAASTYLMLIAIYAKTQDILNTKISIAVSFLGIPQITLAPAVVALFRHNKLEALREHRPPLPPEIWLDFPDNIGDYYNCDHYNYVHYNTYKILISRAKWRDPIKMTNFFLFNRIPSHRKL